MLRYEFFTGSFSLSSCLEHLVMTTDGSLLGSAKSISFCVSPGGVVRDWMRLSCVKGNKLSTRLWAEISLYVNWSQVVGDEVAGLCTPQEMRFSDMFGGARSGKLFVTSSCGSHSVELYYHFQSMIDRIAMYFGYKFVTKIYFSKVLEGTVTPYMNAVRAFSREALSNPEMADRFKTIFLARLKKPFDE